jgi:hypothetical protein
MNDYGVEIAWLLQDTQPCYCLQTRAAATSNDNARPSFRTTASQHNTWSCSCSHARTHMLKLPTTFYTTPAPSSPRKSPPAARPTPSPKPFTQPGAPS